VLFRSESETRSALAGGVTTVVSYFRTGSHYLNKSGPEYLFDYLLPPRRGCGLRKEGRTIASP